MKWRANMSEHNAADGMPGKTKHAQTTQAHASNFLLTAEFLSMSSLVCNEKLDHFHPSILPSIIFT